MNYLQYLLHARGRHGTHSPFVYAFVEQVLHEPKTFDYPAGVTQTAHKKIFRIIRFLERKVFLDATLQQSFLPIIDERTELFQNIEEAASGLIITTIENLPKDFILPKNSFLLVAVPKRNKNINATLKKLFEDPQYRCTIDCWRFVLLTNSDDFGRKQHFVLR